VTAGDEDDGDGGVLADATKQLLLLLPSPLLYRRQLLDKGGGVLLEGEGYFCCTHAGQNAFKMRLQGVELPQRFGGKFGRIKISPPPPQSLHFGPQRGIVLLDDPPACCLLFKLKPSA
jgi:hypothetical protein